MAKQDEERAARLAQALRENLRKRKAQARDSSSTDKTEPERP
jgi:hypothetical protein